MKPTDLTAAELRAFLLTPPDLETVKWVHTQIHHNPDRRLATKVIDSISRLVGAIEELRASAVVTGDRGDIEAMEEYFKRHTATDPWIRAGLGATTALKALFTEVGDLHEACGNLLHNDESFQQELRDMKEASAQQLMDEIPAPPKDRSDDVMDLLEKLMADQEGE